MKPFPQYSPSPTEEAFSQALHTRANAYLAEQQDHFFANGKTACKYGTLLLLLSTSYVAMLNCSDAWLLMVCYISFMFFSVLLALNGLHDAAHGAVFRYGKSNRWFNRIISIPLGLEPEYWRVRHCQFHHAYPNIEGHDLDIEENGILRQSPEHKWYPHMRYQHWYWPLAASFALPYMAWYFDWTDRLGKTALKGTGVLSGWSGWLVFVLHKMNHFVVCLLIPYYFTSSHGLGWLWVIAAYLVAQMVASIIVVFMFLGTHWVEPTFHQPDEQNIINCGWYWHCLGTTCDWIPPKLLSIYLGGSDYHLTHHLFSKWHHRHYPVLADIVQDVAQEYGYPYRRISYQALLKAQRVFLKEMGQNPKIGK